MPTYKNNTANDITFSYLDSNNIRQNVLLEAGESYISEYTLPNPGGFGLTTVANTPYYNPFKSVDGITSTGVGDDQTISLDTNTDEIEIWNDSPSDITLFLQSISNTPGIIIPKYSSRTIDGLRNKINTVIMQFSLAVVSGECYFSEMKK